MFSNSDSNTSVQDAETECLLARIGEDMSRLFAVFLILALVSAYMIKEVSVQKLEGQAVHTGENITNEDSKNTEFLHLELIGDQVKHDGRKISIELVKDYITEKKKSTPDKNHKIIITIYDNSFHRLIDQIKGASVVTNDISFRRIIKDEL